jgi:hypothetical protein
MKTTQPKPPSKNKKQKEIPQKSDYDNAIRSTAPHGYLHPGILNLLAQSQEA